MSPVLLYVLTFAPTDVICVYAAVAQEASSVARVIEAVRRHGEPNRCLFVVGEADASPGLQWITPYAACTMASLNRAAGSGQRALVLCASEHGFVGGFNERLIEALAAVLESGDRFLLLGTRGAVLLAERGREPSWQRPIPTRVSGMPDTVNRLTTELYSRIARGDISSVELMFMRYRLGGIPDIEQTQSASFRPCLAALHFGPPVTSAQPFISRVVGAAGRGIRLRPPHRSHGGVDCQ